MKRYLSALAAVALCTNLAMAAPEESNPVEFMELHQVEIIFHSAASTKNLDLMMSLFTDDASLSVGGKTYSGKNQVRNYFAMVRRRNEPSSDSSLEPVLTSGHVDLRIYGEMSKIVSRAKTKS